MRPQTRISYSWDWLDTFPLQQLNELAEPHDGDSHRHWLKRKSPSTCVRSAFDVGGHVVFRDRCVAQ